LREVRDKAVRRIFRSDLRIRDAEHPRGRRDRPLPFNHIPSNVAVFVKTDPIMLSDKVYPVNVGDVLRLLLAAVLTHGG
jgi:hypothetical protein